STLTNALVGTKVAITSSKPQTTRHAIRGIVNREDGQLVLIDTPGLHRPRTLLGERLNDIVHTTWSEVDVVGLCVPANEKIGPGDRFIAAELQKIAKRTPVVGIVTKTDLVQPQQVAEQLLALQDVMEFAELIREAALEGVRDELPHSIAVTVEEMLPREGRDDLIDVHALLYVERPSQKGIILGHKGERLREVGANARKHIEALLGSKVYLDLHVKVAKDWQRDPKQLRRLGF